MHYLRLFGFMKCSAEIFLLELGTAKLEKREEFEQVMNNHEFCEFAQEQFHFYVLGMKERGTSLGKFWLSYICV